MYTKLSIIIPAYNEEQTIGAVLQSVIAVQLPYGLIKECIVVDEPKDNDNNEPVNPMMGM